MYRRDETTCWKDEEKEELSDEWSACLKKERNIQER